MLGRSASLADAVPGSRKRAKAMKTAASVRRLTGRRKSEHRMRGLSLEMISA